MNKIYKLGALGILLFAIWVGFGKWWDKIVYQSTWPWYWTMIGGFILTGIMVALFLWCMSKQKEE